MNGVKRTGGKLVGVALVVLVLLIVINAPSNSADATAAMWQWFNGSPILSAISFTNSPPDCFERNTAHVDRNTTTGTNQ